MSQIGLSGQKICSGHSSDFIQIETDWSLWVPTKQALIKKRVFFLKFYANMLFMFKYVGIIQLCFGEHWQKDGLSECHISILVYSTTFVWQLNCNKHCFELKSPISQAMLRKKKKNSLTVQNSINFFDKKKKEVKLLSSFCCAFKSPNNCCKYFVIVHSNCCRKKFEKKG